MKSSKSAHLMPLQHAILRPVIQFKKLPVEEKVTINLCSVFLKPTKLVSPYSDPTRNTLQQSKSTINFLKRPGMVGMKHSISSGKKCLEVYLPELSTPRYAANLR